MDARILLIEDDAGLVVAVSDLLAGEGYRVEFAMDGYSGLARTDASTARRHTDEGNWNCCGT